MKTFDTSKHKPCPICRKQPYKFLIGQWYIVQCDESGDPAHTVKVSGTNEEATDKLWEQIQ
ncbi:hypothetical protein [Methylobacter sp.]|uniref:hypothetical protein n=1 Tax=Methylobacter sp. TaxID=2051955 RepID=UPI0012161B05|nr:hypothetical protein [Methylobacter sp.]TAK59508.1 MAG: hypothetical protein EPO18_20315 [Methylobacter sp.]